LWEHRQNLWTFVEVEGVEPTNNAAEQALCQAVIWRKLSFGTQSAEGSRFVERLLTVVEICRRQKRNVFSWLVEAVEARFAGNAAPSLLSGGGTFTVHLDPKFVRSALFLFTASDDELSDVSFCTLVTLDP
jgi:hypothetical protein